MVDIYTYDLREGKPVFEKIKTTSVLEKEDSLASGSALEFAPDGKYLYVSLDGANEVVCLAVGEDGLIPLRKRPRSAGIIRSASLFCRTIRHWSLCNQ